MTESDTDFGVPIPGKILPAQEWARTALKKLPSAGPLDWPALFGRTAPVVLDLGCGNGRFVLSSALRHPELDHFGCDILPLVIRYATKRANQRGLANVRLAVIGAFELLEGYVAPGSIAQIHLYHPQPYKDSERAYKRLITPEFLSLVHRSLAPGGLAVLQTDNRAYWHYIRRVAPLLFDFQQLEGTWPDAPAGRTRREIYARQHGLTIYRGEGTPKPDLTPAQIAEIIRSEPPPRFDAGR